MATVSKRIQPPDPDGQVRPLEAGDRLSRAEEVFPGLWLDPAALVSGDTQTVVAALERGLASPEHAAFVKRLNPPHTEP